MESSFRLRFAYLIIPEGFSLYQKLYFLFFVFQTHVKGTYTGENMSILKKAWPFALACLVVVCVSTFFFLRGNKPLESVTIYKAVQPESKMSQSDGLINDNHNHNGESHVHPHPHPHPESDNQFRSDDWRNDNASDFPVLQEDPWEQIYTQPADTDTSEKTNEETYPPRDWYNTTDRALYIEYYQAQLIKQFGDIPEVYTLAEFEEKMRAEIPMTLDEQIEQAQALYALWPYQETKTTLEMLQDAKASGHPFVHRYQASPETTDPFHDVTPFVEQHGLVEGIRRLSKVNPERAAEVKRMLRERRTQVNPAYIEEVNLLLNENMNEDD